MNYPVELPCNFSAWTLGFHLTFMSLGDPRLEYLKANVKFQGEAWSITAGLTQQTELQQELAGGPNPP